MENHILVLQEGKTVQLFFLESESLVYSFEKEEEAVQFEINCNQLKKFMDGIVSEEKLEASYKEILLEYIVKFHVPVVSINEYNMDWLGMN